MLTEVDGSGRMSGLSLDPDTAHNSRTGMATSSSSSSSSSSLRSSASGSHQALMPSLFSHVPPTINFVLEGQKCELFL